MEKGKLCKICKDKIKNKGNNSKYCKDCQGIYDYLNSRLSQGKYHLTHTSPVFKDKLKHTKLIMKLTLKIKKNDFRY